MFLPRVLWSTMGYLPDRPDRYDHIPIHIDGTGDTAYDEIASIGLKTDDVYYVWVQGDADETESSNGLSDAESVSVAACDSEAELIENFGNFVSKALNRSEVVLVGYKEAEYRGGGFRELRTRCIRTGVEWPLKGFHYTDFGEAMVSKGRFNTSVPSMADANVTPLDDFIDFHDLNVDKSLNKAPKQNAIEAEGYTVEEVHEFAEATGHQVPHASLNNLREVYELFKEDNLLDPIESENAIRDLVEMGDATSIVQHTIADVARTEELYRLADEYTSRDDWHTKRF